MKICWQTRHHSATNAHTNACIGNKLHFWVNAVLPLLDKRASCFRKWHESFRVLGYLSVTEKTSSCSGWGSLYLTTNYPQNRIKTYIEMWVTNLKEHPVIEPDYFRAITSTCQKWLRKTMNTLHKNIRLRAAICIGLVQAGSSKLRLLRWFKRLIGVIQNQIIN